jgi:hypothetical protein
MVTGRGKALCWLVSCGACAARAEWRCQVSAHEVCDVTSCRAGALPAQQSMGIPFSFDTTHGKEVEDPAAKASGKRVASVRTARQYMNRKGGFNRALPAEKTGEKYRPD